MPVMENIQVEELEDSSIKDGGVYGSWPQLNERIFITYGQAREGEADEEMTFIEQTSTLSGNFQLSL